MRRQHQPVAARVPCHLVDRCWVAPRAAPASPRTAQSRGAQPPVSQLPDAEHLGPEPGTHSVEEHLQRGVAGLLSRHPAGGTNPSQVGQIRLDNGRKLRDRCRSAWLTATG